MQPGSRITGGCRVLQALLFLTFMFSTAEGRADDRVVFGLDWRAEAEYGGYYQALANGLYAHHGLNVSIQQGGPQINHMQLLIAGRLDFNLGGGRAIEFVQENLPFLAVAAIFQKDLAVLIAHPGQGNDSFAALKGKPIMIGSDTRNGWWRFLAAKFGYSDSQIRPYTFNMAPFLADKNAIQQGYLSSEPYLIRQKVGFDPVVLPVSDAGYLGYANILTTSIKLVRDRPEMVAALHRCLDRRLVFLSLRRPIARERADQAGQSRHVGRPVGFRSQDNDRTWHC